MATRTSFSHRIIDNILTILSDFTKQPSRNKNVHGSPNLCTIYSYAQTNEV